MVGKKGLDIKNRKTLRVRFGERRYKGQTINEGLGEEKGYCI